MSSYEKAKSLMKTGPARPTLYSVRIGGLDFSDNEYLDVFCNSVSIPGVSHSFLTTLGQEHLGVRNQIPEAVVFESPLQIEVIDDTEFRMYTAFKNLFDRTAIGSNPGGPLINNQRTQRMNYYDNYTFTVDLYKLALPDPNRPKPPRLSSTITLGGESPSEPYDVVERYHFDTCYVTSISPIALSSEAYDQDLRFRVAMHFETYHTSGDLTSIILPTLLL